MDWHLDMQVVVGFVAVLVTLLGVYIAERRQRERDRANEQKHHREMVRAMLIELEMNDEQLRYVTKWREGNSAAPIDRPLDRAALDRSYGSLLDLPSDVQDSVDRTSKALSRFNTLVLARSTFVERGQQFDSLDREIERVVEQLTGHLEHAILMVRTWLVCDAAPRAGDCLPGPRDPASRSDDLADLPPANRNASPA